MEQVAVFVDFENLAIGATETLPERDNPVPYGALDLLCHDYGNAAIRRAYADWSKNQFGKYQEDLGLNGVDLIQVKRFGIQQKNAADIRMAVDAMETLLVHPEVSTFILVAGDGDYSPLVQKLREFGKKVVGVGTEATASRRLTAVCSEYKYWATLVATWDPAAPAALQAEFDVGDARRLLLRAMGEFAGPANAATLKSKMLSMDAAFDQRNYNYVSFRQFLEGMSDLVSTTSIQGTVTVTLKGVTSPNSALPTASSSEKSAIPPLIALLRQRGMDLPQLPESRDSLLVSVYEGWYAGRIETVRDIGSVLLDEETGYVPNARTRGTLRTALIGIKPCLLPVNQGADVAATFADQAIDAPDLSTPTSADWVRAAHINWLAVALRKLKDQPDAQNQLLDTLFAGDDRTYGQELLTDAIATTGVAPAEAL